MKFNEIILLEYGSSEKKTNLINGVLTVKSITPSAGSIYGGTFVTLTGNGFALNSIVKFGSSRCNIINATINHIICKTASHAEQQNVPIEIE
jgi:hypothetical protein